MLRGGAAAKTSSRLAASRESPGIHDIVPLEHRARFMPSAQSDVVVATLAP